MATGDNIEWGRVYSDTEVTTLAASRRPAPQKPFPITSPAPGQGKGLVRRSEHGDKWCPFCQTALNPTTRTQSCERCQPRRQRALDNLRHQSGAVPQETPSQANWREMQVLLDRIDEMSRVVGVAYSMRARNGGMKPQHSEDILVACKDVMVASDDLRRRLQPLRQ